jgi:predicted nuclease of predicted toxin-antitoxin system
MSVTIRLLLDHNVPDSVGEVFRRRGHTVQHVRDILPVDSPDALIATVSEEDRSVLVSCDRDFRLIAPRIPRGMRARFRRLSRISLECGEPQAAKRVEAAMSLIEAEYEIAQASSDARMIIVIQNAGIKTVR